MKEGKRMKIPENWGKEYERVLKNNGDDSDVKFCLQELILVFKSGWKKKRRKRRKLYDWMMKTEVGDDDEKFTKWYYIFS